jgi:hypothetical protein
LKAKCVESLHKCVRCQRMTPDKIRGPKLGILTYKKGLNLECEYKRTKLKRGRKAASPYQDTQNVSTRLHYPVLDTLDRCKDVKDNLLVSNATPVVADID